jgi:hypothetical protein
MSQTQRASVHVNSLGPLGDYFADTSAHTPTGLPWRCIVAHTDATIASATSVGNACPSGTLTNVELIAGGFWSGRFTSVTLASGAVTCYVE